MIKYIMNCNEYYFYNEMKKFMPFKKFMRILYVFGNKTLHNIN